MSETELRLEIRQVCSDFKLNKLKLKQEDGALGAFLQRSCLDYDKNNVARTYVYVDANAPSPQKVVAYISILVSEVKNEDAAVADLVNFRFPYPAMKIARLAVDLKFQRSEHTLGRNLVNFVTALAKRQIMPHVGCRFIMVDANQPAVDFYKKCGFTLLDTEENKRRSEPVMFFDLQKIDRIAS